MQLAKFDSAAFLRDHWQQTPLLIRNPWDRWVNPLEPDELAGLACEPGVESRLVAANEADLAVEHGPLPEDRFASLDERKWTLLVQAVDQHVPEVAALVSPFRFLPNWRIDDVMVSYAADGGGVGAHFDQYDVFLIQGLGRRRWRVGAKCDETTELLPHDELRLIADFQPTEDWVLEPGDILYLPPGFAHDGVALGSDCMTYSIGFRAPSRSELIAGWCDEVLAGLDDDDRYTDPGLAAQANPGEISASALDRLHAMVTEKLLDRETFSRWFGRDATASKYPDADWSPEEDVEVAQVRAVIESGAPFHRNSASRFSFIARDNDVVELFIDGECYECQGLAGDFAKALCAADMVGTWPALATSEPALGLIVTLCNQGSLSLDPEG